MMNPSFSHPKERFLPVAHLSAPLWILLTLLLCGSCHTRQGEVPIRIVTSAGTLTAHIDTLHAPISGKNFLALIDRGIFDSAATFYRVTRPDNQSDIPVKIDVIQGGLRQEARFRDLHPIAHETTVQTGLRHRDGTLSMARMEPGSASSEFFICIGDQKELDFAGKRNPDGQGFAAFGRVTEGMELVREIQQMNAEGQYLSPPVRILSIERMP